MELLELQAYDVMMEVVHADLWCCLALGQGGREGSLRDATGGGTAKERRDRRRVAAYMLKGTRRRRRGGGDTRPRSIATCPPAPRPRWQTPLCLARWQRVVDFGWVGIEL